MLADPTGAFTDAMELAMDLPVLGGKRSKRYSMIVNDGVIEELNVEPDNTGLSCSLADKIKAQNFMLKNLLDEIDRFKIKMRQIQIKIIFKSVTKIDIVNLHAFFSEFKW